MAILIQNLFKLKKGDFAGFNKRAYLWHQNNRKRPGSSLKPFPDWDKVKDLEFEVDEVEYKPNQNYRGKIAICVRLIDNTICKGLSHIKYKNGTTWVLHNDWKNGNCPYVFFRKVR